MKTSELKIGWAETDITPIAQPVSLRGQFYARVSEGVKDPLKATVAAFESGDDHLVLVGCDLIDISDHLRDAVRERLCTASLDARKVILHATHTHTAPQTSDDAMDPFDALPESARVERASGADYVAFAAERIAQAVRSAWDSRAAGSIAFGQDAAVVGRNRRWTGMDGRSTMYGLDEKTRDAFSHIEGYEDHSVNLLATYDGAGALTGVVVNLPSPAQESMHDFMISADFWHETRLELRKRHGEKLFILPQCSAAGELTSYVLYERAAHQRMLEIRNRTEREEVALRIADAVGRILPFLSNHRDHAPVLRHDVGTLELPLNCISEKQVEEALAEAEVWRGRYEEEKRKLEENDAVRREPRWYVKTTQAFRRMNWYLKVAKRYEQQKTAPTRAMEVHVVRLGEIAFATNPFECYLDFGIQIKVRSPFIQTFLIQLAGGGTYLPSPRSVAGGGYGSVPASNPVGSQGGTVLVDYTVEKLRALSVVT
ncbi:MAG TPA: hypothetical protein VNQ90_03710 [Chthoniobacteraceae bacterium]|nr:hypothetical protein [Chthoniobacteraceae bacterium]